MKRYIVWLTSDAGHTGYGPLLMGEVLLGGGFGTPDTAMFTLEQDTDYAGAASLERRWVARVQQRFPVSTTSAVRTAYSDTQRVWHEVPEVGIDEYHCAIAPLSDTRALLVHAGASGLAYATLEGNSWVEAGIIDPRPWTGLHPRFRPRPSGGFWLIWTEPNWLHISSYTDGHWARGDSIACTHQAGQTFISAWCDASRDAAEEPLITWGNLGTGSTFEDVACVAFSQGDTWSDGVEVPGATNAPEPTIARDRNGDAWVAWWPFGEGRTFYAHTYVTATTDAPQMLCAGNTLIVSWNLSQPAPGSYWTVERALGQTDFEDLVRISADSTTSMNWADEGVDFAQMVRYRIRRESVDNRYEWLSEEGVWYGTASAFDLVLASAQPILDVARIQLLGAAAGPARLVTYDVQGRLVMTSVIEASGGGRDEVRIDIKRDGKFPSGLYFVRAMDSRGRISDAVRLAILR